MGECERAPWGWSTAIIAFLGGVGGGVVFPILPVIGADLGISGLMVGVILAANRVARLGFNPVTGSLVDRIGPRWPVAAGLAIEALGTLAFSLALHSRLPALWFLLGRVVWGVGSSMLLVGTLVAVMQDAPASKRSGMTARVRTALSLGVPAGLIIGGLVADKASPNAAFLTATVLSMAGALAALVLLPSTKTRIRSSESSSSENGTYDAALWRELLGIRELRAIWSVTALLFFAVVGVLLATLAVMVRERGIYVFGFGAEGSSGLYMAVMMGARAAASMTAGHYLDRVASRTALLLPATVLTALGLLVLAVSRSVSAVVPALLAIGAGAGGLGIPLLTVLGDLTPKHLYGRALSIYQWSGDLGGALGSIAGLEMGYALGYGAVYGAVGMVILLAVIPLAIHIRRQIP